MSNNEYNIKAPALKNKKVVMGNFYQIPQNVADKVFQELGNSSAQLRIMLVLIGTKEGFNVSEKWILERTGLQHASYINARKALINRGWLTLINQTEIIINYENILGQEKIENRAEAGSTATTPTQAEEGFVF